MARMQRKLLSTPDEVRPFTHGRAEIWELGDAVIGKQVFEPGWRWSNDVKPVAQTDMCEYHHLGMVMSGRLRFETPDGLEMEVGPGMIFEVQPGHDAWVIGDEACIVYDFAGMRTFARPLVGSGQRVLATIVCTDIVDSTATAVRLGDAAWRDLIAEQTSATRRELDRYRGREATTTGDGILATFDGAERAGQRRPPGAGRHPRRQLRVRDVRDGAAAPRNGQALRHGCALVRSQGGRWLRWCDQLGALYQGQGVLRGARRSVPLQMAELSIFERTGVR